jgi:hypothetical protein
MVFLFVWKTGSLFFIWVNLGRSPLPSATYSSTSASGPVQPFVITDQLRQLDPRITDHFEWPPALVRVCHEPIINMLLNRYTAWGLSGQGHPWADGQIRLLIEDFARCMALFDVQYLVPRPRTGRNKQAKTVANCDEA